MASSPPRSPRSQSLSTGGSAEVLIPVKPDQHTSGQKESRDPDPEAQHAMAQNNFVIDKAACGEYGDHGVHEQCKLLDPDDLIPSQETQDMLLKHAETGASLAVHYGHRGIKTGVHYATHFSTQGVVAFQDYVQQGPRAVTNLCLCGGVSTSCLGLAYLAGFSGVIYNPFGYLLHVYMFLFGIATVILEADVDRIADTSLHPAVPHIQQAQGWLHSKIQFLTELNGRGLFYIYQGTLMTTQDCFWCLLFFCGMYNIFMGGLYLAMSAGYIPGVSGKYLEIISQMGNQSSDDEHVSPRVAVSEGDFLQAEAEYKKAMKSKALKGKLQFELYALCTQAQAGDCTTRRPTGILNSGAKARWDAWASLRGMESSAAKVAFVDRVRQHLLPQHCYSRESDAVLE